MGVAETTLQMVRRHVREGAEHITKQRQLIARMREQGLPTAGAERLLANFEDIQRQHEDHLARAEEDQA